MSCPEPISDTLAHYYSSCLNTYIYWHYLHYKAKNQSSAPEMTSKIATAFEFASMSRREKVVKTQET